MRPLVDIAGTTAVPNPIESSAIARPQHPVLITEEGTWTARELRDAVVRFAAALAAAGLEPRTRVGLIGPPSAEWVIASHAIGWLGGSVTPLAHDQPIAELEKALDVANPAAIVVTRGHDAGDRQELDRIFAGRIFEMRALTGEEHDELAERFWPWDEERATLLTSGTTGVSQPVPLTTGQIAMSAFGSMIRLGHSLDDRWLACLPLNHVGGYSILSRAAFAATTVALHPRFVATRVAKALDSGDISLVSLVPTMLERVLEVRGDVPFPETLRAILVGGAGVSPELMERCRVARAPVALTWGMTEAASQITTRFPGDLAADGGSGPPLPFVRVKREEVGTLTIYGPTARGAHRTRDMGFVDEAQRVHITGRRDDTIVSGGENISPSEVENVLRAHPGVRDAVVVGIPDVRWGERPVALLVPANGSPVDDEALREWCRDKLAKFKVPEHFIWVDDIPLGPLGKRPRARARDLAREKAPELFAGEDPDQAPPVDSGEVGRTNEKHTTVLTREHTDVRYAA